MSSQPESGTILDPNDLPIGLRPLTVWEEWDMLACGLKPEQLCSMTPRELAYLADMTVELDGAVF